MKLEEFSSKFSVGDTVCINYSGGGRDSYLYEIYEVVKYNFYRLREYYTKRELLSLYDNYDLVLMSEAEFAAKKYNL